MLHLPLGRGETGRWCAPRRGGGIPPGPARADLHLHCATGARGHPPTRARVRLLGPCYKTGRVGGRRRRGPRTPFFREPIPALRRGAVGNGLRTVRPGRRPRRERGAPSLRRAAERRRGDTAHGPGGSGKVGARGAVKLDAGAPSHLRPRPFQANPETVAAHHRGGSAPGGGRARPDGRPARGSAIAAAGPTRPAGLNPPGGLCGPHPFTS